MAPKTDRLDRLLRQADFPGVEWLSRAAFDALIAEGRVLVNGRRVKKSGEQVSAGQEIALTLPQLGLLMATTPAELLWANPERTIALFQKPAGIPTYPLLPWENETMANRVATFLEKENWQSPEAFAGLAEPPRLEGGLLQRLDRDTSGILAVALRSATKESLRAAFTQGQVGKTYWAIVHGEPKEGSFRFFLQDAQGGKARAQLDAAGETELKVSVRKSHGNFTWVEVSTSQGSRHVVRASLAALGHPLVGDRSYGGGEEAPFHQLHARALRLAHVFPDLHAPPPQSFLDCLQKLGLN